MNKQECPTCAPSRGAGLARCRDCGRTVNGPTTWAIVADTRIETPDGWRIMIGRIGEGRPVEEWRALARLIVEAPAMRAILDAVAHDPKNAHQGVALALLTHIDGTEGN